MILQRLRDDCEVTALSMVLGYAAKPVGQLTLQRQVAAAKPLDPAVGPHGKRSGATPASASSGGPTAAARRGASVSTRDRSARSRNATASP
jgi:uncharacterized protein YvpB